MKKALDEEKKRKRKKTLKYYSIKSFFYRFVGKLKMVSE